MTTNVGNSLAEVAEKIQDSVVGVRTESGEGSGVVFTGDGYVLTNNHVVANANGNLTVTFSDNSKTPAKLIGTDPANDLAVLKVDRSEGLHPITFGDSDAIKVGDPVLAIGNPLGYAGTVTSGILSAKNRTISESGEEESPFAPRQSVNRLSGLLQTDAAINPGNSGGALVDSAGRLVGINTAIATSGSGSRGNIGVGFAIPSNKVKVVAEQLMKGGKVAHPYIGVRVSNSETKAGAEIAGVDPGSPAEKAGLKQGDLVTAIDGKTVRNSDELVSMVQAVQPGSKLSLIVVRDGKTSTIEVTVGEKTS
ncbi:MAG: trypsin-like peptidase domain-containing protein [Longispora sp.]|nr:trypsin-like peptidase domain-containing protein [Longispora sp. (in: high G+C Gram-positive bacteria)]